MIKDVLQDSTILVENVYNMNETKVMLFMSNSIKVLVSKLDMRDYRNARVKRIIVIAIECINDNDKYLNSIII